MLITVLLPSGKQAQLQIADTDLIYDGQQFVAPQLAHYVELYTVPVTALSLPFNAQGLTNVLTTTVRWVVLVLGSEPLANAVTDPSAVIAPNPNPSGDCVCFVTCAGTELRFIRVIAEN